MNNLNDKVWYRFLKVVFIISFLFILIASVGGTWVFLSEVNDISQQTFERVGHLIKSLFPEKITPTTPNDKEFGERIYEESPSTWYKFVSSGSKYEKGTYEGKDFTKIYEEYQNKFVPLQIIGFCLIPLAIVCIIFWLVSRIFFYIFLKDKFFSGRLVNTFKKILIKK